MMNLLSMERIAILFISAIVHPAYISTYLNGAAPTNAHSLPTVPMENYSEGSLLWMQDSRDSQCLGPHGFGECGDVNIWRIWHTDNLKLRFEYVSNVDSDVNDEEKLCLSRQFSWRGESRIGLSHCRGSSLFSSTRWTLSPRGGLMNTVMGKDYCLVRLGNTVRAELCSKNSLQEPMLRSFRHSFILSVIYSFHFC
jgi:hypothetical protein